MGTKNKLGVELICAWCCEPLSYDVSTHNGFILVDRCGCAFAPIGPEDYDERNDR